jgi:hypothetical protein
MASARLKTGCRVARRLPSSINAEKASHRLKANQSQAAAQRVIFASPLE